MTGLLQHRRLLRSFPITNRCTNPAPSTSEQGPVPDLQITEEERLEHPNNGGGVTVQLSVDTGDCSWSQAFCEL